MIAEEKTWYLGPVGDLRALPVPESEVSRQVVRYGGIHQALSGARTVDVTGHRATYDFVWRFMEEEHFQWVYGMHVRGILGPFRLIDPLFKNRLSLPSSILEIGKPNSGGVNMSGGLLERVIDAPAGLPVYHSREWSNWPAPSAGSAHFVRLAHYERVAVLPEEDITFSIYLRSPNAVQNLRIAIDYFEGNTQAGRYVDTRSIGTTWTRETASVTIPVGVTNVQIALLTEVDAVYANPFRFAAPQLETGLSVTAWEYGGGSAVVEVDQFSTTSPRYPFFNTQLTLLEV